MEKSSAENELIEADLSHDSQKLMCVDFPGNSISLVKIVTMMLYLSGIVQNVDAAIEKLGGKSALSQVATN